MSGGHSPAPELAEVGAPARWTRGRVAGLALGPLALAALALVPSGLHRIEGVGARPAYAAGVAAWMAVWWFTEAVPIAWTACLPLLLYPALSVFGGSVVSDLTSAAVPFVDAYIFLFLGGMAIGAAMEEQGLHRRVALHILAAVGAGPRRLLLGMLVATASISLWISNTATAVMMLPIAMALLAQLEATSGRRLSGLGAALMLAVAYGANVGGIGTKIGTATNSIFCGFAADRMAVDLAFLRYAAIGMPFVVAFVPVIWLALWRVARKDQLAGVGGGDVVRRELAALGSPGAGERKVALVFFAAALLWIFADPLRRALAPHVPPPWPGFRFQGKHFEAGVALVAAAALLATRAVTLAALRRIPWGTLLLLGGSFSMASGIEASGLAGWVATHLEGIATFPLPAQTLVASSATVALSAIASNTATINLMLHVLPRSLPVLSAAALAASCDFALPAGTPPNAIVFGSGRIRLPVMMRTGVVLDLAAALLVALHAGLLVPHLLP